MSLSPVGAFALAPPSFLLLISYFSGFCFSLKVAKQSRSSSSEGIVFMMDFPLLLGGCSFFCSFGVLPQLLFFLSSFLSAAGFFRAGVLTPNLDLQATFRYLPHALTHVARMSTSIVSLFSLSVSSSGTSSS
ncbi:hypothetical protein QL285_081720 [Trifolium repens]|nr:hypothetical protein QL285_081720 [Trifolium repens]